MAGIPQSWNQDVEWWFVELYHPTITWTLPVSMATIMIGDSGDVEVDAIHTEYEHLREGWATRLFEAIIERWPHCTWTVTGDGEYLSQALVEQGIACQYYKSQVGCDRYTGVPIEFRDSTQTLNDAFSSVRESLTGDFWDLLDSAGVWRHADTTDVYTEFRRRGVCPLLADEIHMEFKHWLRDGIRNGNPEPYLAEVA